MILILDTAQVWDMIRECWTSLCAKPVYYIPKTHKPVVEKPRKKITDFFKPVKRKREGEDPLPPAKRRKSNT